MSGSGFFLRSRLFSASFSLRLTLTGWAGVSTLLAWLSGVPSRCEDAWRSYRGAPTFWQSFRLTKRGRTSKVRLPFPAVSKRPRSLKTESYAQNRWWVTPLAEKGSEPTRPTRRSLLTESTDRSQVQTSRVLLPSRTIEEKSSHVEGESPATRTLTVSTGEFDPGSERTLAARLTHASRTRKGFGPGKVAHG